MTNSTTRFYTDNVDTLMNAGETPSEQQETATSASLNFEDILFDMSLEPYAHGNGAECSYEQSFNAFNDNSFSQLQAQVEEPQLQQYSQVELEPQLQQYSQVQSQPQLPPHSQPQPMQDADDGVKKPNHKRNRDDENESKRLAKRPRRESSAASSSSSSSSRYEPTLFSSGSLSSQGNAINTPSQPPVPFDSKAEMKKMQNDISMLMRECGIVMPANYLASNLDSKAKQAQLKNDMSKLMENCLGFPIPENIASVDDNKMNTLFSQMSPDFQRCYNELESFLRVGTAGVKNSWDIRNMMSLLKESDDLVLTLMLDIVKGERSSHDACKILKNQSIKIQNEIRREPSADQSAQNNFSLSKPGGYR